MQNNYRERHKKGFKIMRLIYDLTMAILILSAAVVMFFAKSLDIEKYIVIDPLMRKLFGGICVLYGGFRLYRAIKSKDE
jgi:hypothetical protein